ncbi:MAG: hypothetical protein IPO55_03575 [Alphaproteobacteria bacterium]|nr:hypothetical protein [Alphaproteobacteria bacterium]
MKEKPYYSPAQIAALATENMQLSAPDVDLNTLVDMKQLANTMIDTMRETRLVLPHMINSPVSRH